MKYIVIMNELIFDRKCTLFIGTILKEHEPQGLWKIKNKLRRKHCRKMI